MKTTRNPVYRTMKTIKRYAQYLREALGANLVMPGGQQPHRGDVVTDLDGNPIKRPGKYGGVYYLEELPGSRRYLLDFRRANLKAEDLSGAFFKDCMFDEADFRGSNLNGTKFERCSFVGAKGLDTDRGAKFIDCVF
jgi:hypothetical protein